MIYVIAKLPCHEEGASKFVGRKNSRQRDN